MQSAGLPKKRRILLAVLDWGLGHASRCVPIIKALLPRNTEVILAGNGQSLALLEKEFPELQSLTLPAYDIRYGSANMTLNIAKQSPKILQVIYREHRLLRKLIRQYKLDAIVSDSRFGCFSSAIPTVFISHQININVPFAPFGRLVNKLNKTILNRFTECWIPDYAGTVNLSGALSHPAPIAHARFIGPLSRLNQVSDGEKYDILALLSGPEPQRSILERKLVEQLLPRKEKILLVQGKMEQYKEEWLSPTCKRISYVLSEQLSGLMSQADLIICRSGYSSLMDLARLQKKSLLIPTPGQTEQEYLARYAAAQGWAFSQKQSDLDVENGIELARKRRGFRLAGEEPSLIPVLENFLMRI